MYCYSWWIVPHNYPKIMKDYGMDHIPHITIKSRMSYPEYHPDIGKEFELRFYGNMISLYPSGYGVMCEVKGLGDFSMTINYLRDHDSTQNNLEQTMGIFCCAKTIHPNPKYWKIITDTV